MLAAYALLILISFSLHLIWERLHIRLYTAYEKMKGRLPVFVFATVGDVVYTLCAVVLYGMYRGSATWFLEADAVDFVSLGCIGFCIALYVEYKAFVYQKWQYTPAMWIIPLLRVGLSPVAQMSILLPLSVYIVGLLSP